MRILHAVMNFEKGTSTSRGANCETKSTSSTGTKRSSGTYMRQDEKGTQFLC
jgi:hypothetical protein